MENTNQEKGVNELSLPEKFKQYRESLNFVKDDRFEQKDIKPFYDGIFQDGRVVYDLLKEGHSKTDLISAVALETRMDYARQVLNGVTAEIDAEQNIHKLNLDWYDKDSPHKEHKEYLREIKELFKYNGRFTSSMDVSAAASLIRSGFTEKEIEGAIVKRSPICKRPGISLGIYLEQVMDDAVKKVVLEQERHSNNIMADYKQWNNHIINRKGYRPGQEADVEIAQVLFVKGYERHQIHYALRFSPESAEMAGRNPMDVTEYAQKITQRALTPEIKKHLQNISKDVSLGK